LWFTRKNLAVIPVLFLIVMMLAGGATRTAHAVQGLPGMSIGKGLAPSDQLVLNIRENGTLITLPGPEVAGDIVLCETPIGVPGTSGDGAKGLCNAGTPSSWSDVLRFCDTPLNDAACKSATTATHAQLFTDGEGAIAGFTDEFTFHSLDASKLAHAVFVDESTTGPTIYLGFTINSDPTGPGEVVEHPVGGHVVSINMTALVGPWLAVTGVLGCAVVVAVAVKRHRQ
jgi:hypothetical protein